MTTSELIELAESKGYKHTFNYAVAPDEYFIIVTALIQQWLRKEHNLHIATMNRLKVKEKYLWSYFISNWGNMKAQPATFMSHGTYEDCINEAIREAIKLIR